MTFMGKVAYTVLVASIASILTLLAVNWLAPADESGPTSVIVQPSPTQTAVADDTTPGPNPSPTTSTSPEPASPVPADSPTPTGENGITLEQVATHDSPSNCWIVVNGIVYDVTTYLSSHPADYDVLLAWCGKEASQAYADKGGLDESHSSRADALLERYEIGPLAP